MIIITNQMYLFTVYMMSFLLPNDKKGHHVHANSFLFYFKAKTR